MFFRSTMDFNDLSLSWGVRTTLLIADDTRILSWSPKGISRKFSQIRGLLCSLLLCRDLELFQFGDDVLAGVGRVDHFVDRHDLAVRADIEGPAVGEFTEISAVVTQHAVLI